MIGSSFDASMSSRPDLGSALQLRGAINTWSATGCEQSATRSDQRRCIIQTRHRLLLRQSHAMRCTITISLILCLKIANHSVPLCSSSRFATWFSQRAEPMPTKCLDDKDRIPGRQRRRFPAGLSSFFKGPHEITGVFADEAGPVHSAPGCGPAKSLARVGTRKRSTSCYGRAAAPRRAILMAHSRVHRHGH